MDDVDLDYDSGSPDHPRDDDFDEFDGPVTETLPHYTDEFDDEFGIDSIPPASTSTTSDKKEAHLIGHAEDHLDHTKAGDITINESNRREDEFENEDVSGTNEQKDIDTNRISDHISMDDNEDLELDEVEEGSRSHPYGGEREDNGEHSNENGHDELDYDDQDFGYEQNDNDNDNDNDTLPDDVFEEFEDPKGGGVAALSLDDTAAKNKEIDTNAVESNEKSNNTSKPIGTVTQAAKSELDGQDANVNPMSKLPAGRNGPPIRQKPCRYFMQDGFCRFGDNCTYAHINPNGLDERLSDRIISSRRKIPLIPHPQILGHNLGPVPRMSNFGPMVPPGLNRPPPGHPRPLLGVHPPGHGPLNGPRGLVPSMAPPFMDPTGQFSDGPLAGRMDGPFGPGSSGPRPLFGPAHGHPMGVGGGGPVFDAMGMDYGPDPMEMDMIGPGMHMDHMGPPHHMDNMGPPMPMEAMGTMGPGMMPLDMARMSMPMDLGILPTQRPIIIVPGMNQNSAAIVRNATVAWEKGIGEAKSMYLQAKKRREELKRQRENADQSQEYADLDVDTEIALLRKKRKQQRDAEDMPFDDLMRQHAPDDVEKNLARRRHPPKAPIKESHSQAGRLIGRLGPRPGHDLPLASSPTTHSPPLVPRSSLRSDRRPITDERISDNQDKQGGQGVVRSSKIDSNPPRVEGRLKDRLGGHVKRNIRDWDRGKEDMIDREADRSPRSVSPSTTMGGDSKVRGKSNRLVLAREKDMARERELIYNEREKEIQDEGKKEREDRERETREERDRKAKDDRMKRFRKDGEKREKEEEEKREKEERRQRERELEGEKERERERESERKKERDIQEELGEKKERAQRDSKNRTKVRLYEIEKEEEGRGPYRQKNISDRESTTDKRREGNDRDWKIRDRDNWRREEEERERDRWGLDRDDLIMTSPGRKLARGGPVKDSRSRARYEHGGLYSDSASEYSARPPTSTRERDSWRGREDIERERDRDRDREREREIEKEIERDLDRDLERELERERIWDDGRVKRRGHEVLREREERDDTFRGRGWDGYGNIDPPDRSIAGSDSWDRLDRNAGHSHREFNRLRRTNESRDIYQEANSEAGGHRNVRGTNRRNIDDDNSGW